MLGEQIHTRQDSKRFDLVKKEVSSIVCFVLYSRMSLKSELCCWSNLAARALRAQLTLAGLQQHALAHDGGAHRLIAAQHPLHHHQARHHHHRHSHHSPNSWDPHLQTLAALK